MFCGSAVLGVLVCGRLWALEVRSLVAQVNVDVCMGCRLMVACGAVVFRVMVVLVIVTR